MGARRRCTRLPGRSRPPASDAAAGTTNRGAGTVDERLPPGSDARRAVRPFGAVPAKIAEWLAPRILREVVAGVRDGRRQRPEQRVDDLTLEEGEVAVEGPLA